MKDYVPVIEQTVSAITCDRCNAHYDAGDVRFESFTSIRHKCGFESVWDDGQIVEIDLCENCLKDLTEDFCRLVSTGAEGEYPVISKKAQVDECWDDFFQSIDRVTDDLLNNRNQSVKIDLLGQLAIEMMQGDAEAAKEWLTTPLDILQGKTPKERAEESDGFEDVVMLIGRLRNGVFS